MSENLTIGLIIVMGVALSITVVVLLLGGEIIQQKSAFISAGIDQLTPSEKNVIQLSHKGGDSASLNSDALLYSMDIFIDTSSGSYLLLPPSGVDTFKPGTNLYIYNNTGVYTLTSERTVATSANTLVPTQGVGVRLVDNLTHQVIAQWHSLDIEEKGGTIDSPVVSFAADATSGPVTHTFTFTDSSTNTPTSWAWTFGDAGTSTDKNPTHQYTAAGKYTVALTATNAGGSNTLTKTDYITVSAAPVAGFAADATSGPLTHTFTFTDSSTNTPTSWAWTFGDAGTSTDQNPTHQYTAAGKYTVALTATNAGGSNTATKTDYITVSAAPVASFTVNPSSGYTTQTFTFTDTSTNTPTSWAWTFGDGGTSTDKNPTHQYTTTGTKTVALTATNAGGSNTVTNTVTVTNPPAPVASFTESPSSGPTTQTFTFTDSSTNTPTSWAWTFGDGGTSTAQNPTHQYTTTGTKTISLTATNAGGSNTASNTVTVRSATHTITASITSGSSRGSISPSGAVTVADGGSQSFTMTPKSGRRISSVTVDGTALSGFPLGYNVPYTYSLFTNVIADHTIKVVFS
nr:PKD domain-containing protein [uncultured Methanoregula sp.]